MFEQVIKFVTGHWILCLAFAAIVLLIILNELRERLLGIRRLSPEAVTDLINHHHAKLIDLRGNADFKKGHIIGAVNIPMKELGDKLSVLEADKNRPIILICSNGFQAPDMGQLLKKAGFGQVFCLGGGINNWQQSNLPLTKK